MQSPSRSSNTTSPEDLLVALLLRMAQSPNPPSPPASTLRRWSVALEALVAKRDIQGETRLWSASPVEQLAILHRPPSPARPQFTTPLAYGQAIPLAELGACLHRKGDEPEHLLEDLPDQASALLNSNGGLVCWGLERQQGVVVVGMNIPSQATMDKARYALGLLWPKVELDRHYTVSQHPVEGTDGLVVVVFAFPARTGITCVQGPLFSKDGLTMRFERWIKELEEEEEDEEAEDKSNATMQLQQIKSEVKEEREEGDEEADDKSNATVPLQQIKSEVKEEELQQAHSNQGLDVSSAGDPLAAQIATLIREKPGKQWITQEIRRALHQRRVQCTKTDINRALYKSGLFVSHKDGGDTVWRLK